MKYNQLSLNANKSRNRIGRGISAGQGKTAGRGTKGQKSRTGKTAKPGFEGGSNPLMQRVPKLRGFKPFWASAITVTTDKVAELITVTNDSLAEAGLIDNKHLSVRLVLGKKPVTTKLSVKLQGASKMAIAAIEKAGGTFEKIDRVARVSTKSSDTK